MLHPRLDPPLPSSIIMQLWELLKVQICTPAPGDELICCSVRSSFVSLKVECLYAPFGRLGAILSLEGQLYPVNFAPRVCLIIKVHNKNYNLHLNGAKYYSPYL